MKSAVPNAGLQVPAALAQKLGGAELVDERLTLPEGVAGRANCDTKATTVIGAMLAGADSIDDVDVLRAGATPELFDQIRAPSTIGTWLRAFNWAAVRMLDAVSREVLARAWKAGLDPELQDDLSTDLDPTVCEVYGAKKQGAKYGYTKVRGYHPLPATPEGSGEVLHARMRGGNAGSARGAASLARETISRVRNAGTAGALTLRADSAFYSKTCIRACRDHDARFSVTVKRLKPIKGAMAAIPDEDWVSIDSWLEGGADVAETTYTAFRNAAGAAWQHATTETLRTKLVSRPARRVHTARRIKLPAPTNWPWRQPFDNALTRAAAVPAPT